MVSDRLSSSQLQAGEVCISASATSPSSPGPESPTPYPPPWTEASRFGLSGSPYPMLVLFLS